MCARRHRMSRTPRRSGRQSGVLGLVGSLHDVRHGATERSRPTSRARPGTGGGGSGRQLPRAARPRDSRPKPAVPARRDRPPRPGRTDARLRGGEGASGRARRSAPGRGGRPEARAPRPARAGLSRGAPARRTLLPFRRGRGVAWTRRAASPACGTSDTPSTSTAGRPDGCGRTAPTPAAGGVTLGSLRAGHSRRGRWRGCARERSGRARRPARAARSASARE